MRSCVPPQKGGPGHDQSDCICAACVLDLVISIYELQSRWFWCLNLKSWPNLASESWPRSNCVTSTKHQLQFQISPEFLLQNLDQILCSKSKQKLCFMTEPQLPNLLQTVANTILITNISNSNNLNIFPRQGHIKFIKREWVSESVTDDLSVSVTSIANNDRARVR